MGGSESKQTVGTVDENENPIVTGGTVGADDGHSHIQISRSRP